MVEMSGGENEASPKQQVSNRVLYIEASPMGEKSHSTQVAQAFLSSYRETNPQEQIKYLLPFSFAIQKVFLLVFEIVFVIKVFIQEIVLNFPIGY